MNCENCDCKLEADEESDILRLLNDGKHLPQWCTECTETWANSALEEPAKTEWDSEH